MRRCQWNAQKELRETNRELAALLEISQTATRSLETEKILDDTLNKSLEILDFDVGYIRTLDAEKKNLIVRVARGLSSPEFLSTAFPLDSPDPVVGKKVFETQEPYICSDIRKDPMFQARTMEKEGVISLAMVPIVSKQRAMGFIAVGSKKLHEFTDREVHLLSAFSSQLGAALENARLYDTVQAQAAQLSDLNKTLEHRVEEQVTQLERLGRLKRFFSSQLAELIVSGDAEDPLKTHRREITVVYLDLRGFTAFAETSEPEEVMGVLHEYHAEMGQLILQHEGTLEHFAGDGIMIFFNDPLPVPNPAERAILMALAMRERVKDLTVKWRKLGYELDFGVGIAQGYATIGAIGFEGRWEYGAIGSVPNLAARLCGEA
ncbi:MAG TPA: adenylate/guanylate cyclase domain-containing protein, partial [Candidatus Binatia bacterium]|nr:adenylate/guanylate cyclase domain-containing protein [Candidatus Binatia bacterium]